MTSIIHVTFDASGSIKFPPDQLLLVSSFCDKNDNILLSQAPGIVLPCVHLLCLCQASLGPYTKSSE